MLSGKVLLGYLHRQQWLKVCPRSPSPLCYRRPSLPCCTRHPPRASTLTPRSPAEVQSNTVHPTWNSYRQSWETWGTSSIRWRASTSMALLMLSPSPATTVDVMVSIKGVLFTALIQYLSRVAAKKSNCWWMSSMRRKGFAWLYRCVVRNKGIHAVRLLEC